MKKIAYILIFISLFLNLTAPAQIPHINFTSLTFNEGLLSNSVNVILKDSQGLMWFGTDDGLNRFDGTNFKVYRNQKRDTTSIRANEILALHEDKRGNLWIGTSGGGFSLYDRRKDIFHHFPLCKNIDGLTRNSVIRSICSDYLGKIWIAQFHGLFVFDPDTKATSKLALLTEKNDAPGKITLNCVFEDSKHRIWVATDNGLFLFNRETGIFRQFVHNDLNKSSLSSNKVRAIAEDRSGNIWVGTVDGLCMMQPGGMHEFVVYRHIPGKEGSLSNNTINCISVDKNGLLWIGTSEGLNVFNPTTQQFSVYKPEKGNIYSLTTLTTKTFICLALFAEVLINMIKTLTSLI
jgi:ligand-binding sensor domain-containing protein